jgi:cell fate (sporulation/competence/biofilm development) regulator YmcA (YheA/YmcA/DUF963 family)
MSDMKDPLESPEAFQSYCERVRQLLQSHITERIEFLQDAQSQIHALESLARQASDIALTQELAVLARQCERQISALQNAEGRSVTEREITALGVPISSSPPVRSPETLRYLDNGSPHLPPVAASSEIRPPAGRPPSAPPRIINAPSQPPATPRRPLEEIYRDTDMLDEEANAELHPMPGTAGLIRLKALLCRQRAMQAELAAQDVQPNQTLRYLHGYLRRRVDEEHGPGHYLIALRNELWPAEAWPWNHLAYLYEGLAAAYEALDWYEENDQNLTKPEQQEVLESIAAHQTRLWRHLQTYYPRQNDEHQINLFRDLCALAEQQDLYLFTLQERCPDDTLNERAESLPVILENLRMDRENRTRREATLQMLRSLLAEPDFGTRENDRQRLTEAVVRCRAEGLPASSTALRALLMDWVAILEESEERVVQEVARELLKETERQALRAETELAEVDRPLSEAEQEELDAVRALVRGKRCLFIGGICREESRQRLENELQLASLVWPSTNGAESVYKFDSDIQNTDITVILIRFMRTGWGQARELAVKHQKQFVRLPAGYGLRQVVRQFYRQLVPHDIVVISDK